MKRKQKRKCKSEPQTLIASLPRSQYMKLANHGIEITKQR